MKDCPEKSKQSKLRYQFLHTRHNNYLCTTSKYLTIVSRSPMTRKLADIIHPVILYTPAYYFIQVKSTVKTNYICTRGQFGPLHICVGESPKCCIAVVVFEPHNLLSAVRLSPHTVEQNRSHCSRINLFVCLFIWTSSKKECI